MQIIIIRIFKILTLAFFSAVLLGGCDQVRQKLGDLLSPPSPAECVIRVEQLIASSDFQKAVLLGEDYLKNNNFASKELHLVVAKAYLELGDATKAMEHTRAANRTESGPLNGKADVLTEEPQQKIEAGDASVTETRDGTVLKAGDATVVLPK
jgi:hypothetical protein